MVVAQPDDRSTAMTRWVGHATGALGSFPMILVSFLLVAVWFAGAFVIKGGFGNTNYQLVINTGTTIVTFWMVFIIQNTQNRDGRAMQAKLDAQSHVLRALAEQSGITDAEILDRLIGVEDAPEKVIKADQDDARRLGKG